MPGTGSLKDRTQVEATKLIRRELPIQSVNGRDDDCTATVPIHLSIMKLPTQIRTDASLISNAKEAVRKFYNEDMVHHLKVLKETGYSTSEFRGYEEFRDDWFLNGTTDTHGFLKLTWKENGQRV